MGKGRPVLKGERVVQRVDGGKNKENEDHTVSAVTLDATGSLKAGECCDLSYTGTK